MKALRTLAAALAIASTCGTSYAGRGAARVSRSKVTLNVPECLTKGHRGGTPTKQHRFLRNALNDLRALQRTRPKDFTDRAKVREHDRRSNQLVKRIFKYRGTIWSQPGRGGLIVVEPHGTRGSYLNLVAHWIRQSTKPFSKSPLSLVYNSRVGIRSGGFYTFDTLHVGWMPISADGIDVSLAHEFTHGWFDSFANSGGFVLPRGRIRGLEPRDSLRIEGDFVSGMLNLEGRDLLELYRKDYNIDEPFAYAVGLAFAGRRLRALMDAGNHQAARAYLATIHHQGTVAAYLTSFLAKSTESAMQLLREQRAGPNELGSQRQAPKDAWSYERKSWTITERLFLKHSFGRKKAPEQIFLPVVDRRLHRLELQSNHGELRRQSRVLLRNSVRKGQAIDAQAQVVDDSLRTVTALNEIYSRLEERFKILKKGTSPYALDMGLMLSVGEISDLLTELGTTIRPFLPSVRDSDGRDFLSRYSL